MVVYRELKEFAYAIDDSDTLSILINKLSECQSFFDMNEELKETLLI